MNKKKILIVEDDPVSSALTATYARELGYDVLCTVSTGREAVDSAGSLKPDLVIMDVVLRGNMDGIDAARNIYENYRVPVIFITQSSLDENLDRIRNTNPFGYLIKPVDRHELRVSIEMALLKFSMEMKLKESEERYSSILESISDAVVVVDDDRRITYFNRVAEEMTGAPGPSALGRKVDDIIIFNDAEEGDSSPAETAGGNGKSRILRLSVRESEIPVDLRISAMRDGKGSSKGRVMVFRDVSESIKSENRIHESLKLLRKAMGGVIQAIAFTVEKKDPYTAGHQRKVANIARFIANRMNLSQDIIEGIRMAGVIHDLGKISIPAEILSKPGKITEAEFNLIKSHPQIGYDILKNIDFPWPVAEIVYQHHEHLDGSGYPRGLKEGGILMESKIIAVADVIEAMASHRPYRPSLGIEMALQEIAAHEGTFYDTEVVRTCITIFRTEGITFDDL